MNPYRTVILLALGAFLVYTVARRMRRMRLKERHAIVLILTAVPFGVLAVWPDLINWLCGIMDIHYSTVLLAGVSLFFLLIVLELLSLVSVMERRISTLAQMVSILNERQGLVGRDVTPVNAGPAPNWPTVDV
ncbi:MAG: DUF2304 domain-containing protein [Planctomycetota bacterium]|jgi:hypothetical protein